MRIAVISDTHGHLPEVSPVDLALICGDIMPANDHSRTFQRSWLDTNFREWLVNIVSADKIIGIAGNHDFIFQTEPMTVNNMFLPWTYLQDSGTRYEGLNIWGSPWVPNLPDWAFYASDQMRDDKWWQIPDDTNILITHGPPRNIRDMTCPRYGSVHAGCAYLAERVTKLPNLKLHVYGHIHEARGKTEALGCKFINASYVDENYLTYSAGVVYLEL